MQTTISVRRCHNRAVNKTKDRKNRKSFVRTIPWILREPLKRSTFALEKHQGAQRRIGGKVNPGARPWNLKNLYDKPNKRKERVTGCPGICAGHFPTPELPSGPEETLYVEKLRFRRCFLCSRYHASVECLGKMSPQGALFFPRVRFGGMAKDK